MCNSDSERYCCFHIDIFITYFHSITATENPNLFNNFKRWYHFANLNSYAAYYINIF